ncbi:hypothetical protein [Sphingomonas baiyangensis]|uniref:Uncharacterized protein n=1 Tax=Sphingomonas baiyangensis TaxID=2572576 RepID=A0A4U1L1Z2_9SPHN|nr:hypothetical protein [Sphingomonas baiyangensis]TKD50230.1 hypothetical protein FBR43_05265 [Sphingomonas baiyangensis]
MTPTRAYDLSQYINDDFKYVFAFIGFDMTAATFSLAVALYPGGPVLIDADAFDYSVLEVATDDAGFAISQVEVFAPKATFPTVYADNAEDYPTGAHVPLYYDLKVSSLPGDVGTPAETTLLYGQFILKGTVND